MSTIPNHAKKVFKGEVFHIYQWEQTMFDSRTAIFEKAQTLDGGSVIATIGKKIIILKQKQPGTGWYYSLPGGYFEHPKENPKKGVVRELLEETGYKPGSIKLYKIFDSKHRVHSNHFLYIARDCVKVAEPCLDGGEIIKLKLVSFEEFLKYSDNPHFHHRDIIIELLRARLSKKAKSEFKKLIFG